MVTAIAPTYEAKSKASVAPVVCHHYWIIDSADGRVSKGVCKLCGAGKEFPNYLPDCLHTTEEEYENWLARQRDMASKMAQGFGK
jgi:hypothetical protein